jgi:hypothetical protein
VPEKVRSSIFQLCLKDGAEDAEESSENGDCSNGRNGDDWATPISPVKGKSAAAEVVQFDCYKLNVPRNDILFVRERKDYLAAVDALSKSVRCVGCVECVGFHYCIDSNLRLLFTLIVCGIKIALSLSIYCHTRPAGQPFAAKKSGYCNFESRFLYYNLVFQTLTGLDAEHRPTSFLSEETVALVQLATMTHVYILDMNQLRKTLTTEDWTLLKEKYFLAPAVTILGFGIRGDLQIIARSLPYVFGDLETSAAAVIDLDFLDRRLMSSSEGLMMRKPHLIESGRAGLSGLTESVFGKPLDKKDQMSDWDKRPLTENQVGFQEPRK